MIGANDLKSKSPMPESVEIRTQCQTLLNKHSMGCKARLATGAIRNQKQAYTRSCNFQNYSQSTNLVAVNTWRYSSSTCPEAIDQSKLAQAGCHDTDLGDDRSCNNLFQHPLSAQPRGIPRCMAVVTMMVPAL